MAQESEKLAVLKELRELLEHDPARVGALLEPVHAADIADWLQDLDEHDQRRVFRGLDTETRAEVLENADDTVRQTLVEALEPAELTAIVEELPADEVVDLLALVDESKAESVLRGVDLERAKGLRELKRFPSDTAGGQMTTEVISVRSKTRIGDVIKEIKHEGETVEEGEGVFVVDEAGRPVGYITDRSLLTHSIHEVVDDVMTEPFSVSVHQDQEEAATLFRKYSLQALAVVDDAGRLVGVLDFEDAQEVLEEEASEDIMRLVGTSPTHQTRLPVLTRVSHRLPLQGVTVMGGLVTAMILDTFLDQAEGDAGGTAALMRFIPIVIGLAGNVGIQSSTILVRAFATGEVEPDRELSVLYSEVLTGLVMGILCGLATLPVAAYMEHLQFASAVGMAIAAAVTWAAFLGCIVPMSCRRVGIDPAVVAGPFLITLSDISGILIFVGVANVVLLS
jgi:magnesium transporter